MYNAPDFVIYLGIRAFMSMAGVLVTVASYWIVERKWDEAGTAAYHTAAAENAAEGDYQFVDESGKNKKFVTNADQSRDAISVSTEDYRDMEAKTPTVQVPREALERALPVQIGVIVGLAVWTVSFLFRPGQIVALYVGWNICWLFFLPVIAAMIAVPLRRATIERDVELKKKAGSVILFGAFWLVIGGIFDRQTDAPWYFCFLGVLFLMVSYHVLHESRKMGVTWELDGQPAPEVSAQHLGALNLILGFFLLWVGTNATAYEGENGYYIPIYLNYRTWVSFASAFFIIIPALLALDFAFDQGSQPVPYAGRICRLDGSTFVKAAQKMTYFSAEYFAGCLETPWFLVAGWILFGLCAFMPFGSGFNAQKLIACILGICIGIIYGLRVLPAYWNRDWTLHRRWIYIYYAFMAFLFTTIGVDGQGSLVSSMLGVFLILFGQHVDNLEKKRGKYWIQDGELNPRDIAFGYGHPMYVLGWLLLCMAMSTPMS